jgi:hypothetical protein
MIILRKPAPEYRKYAIKLNTHIQSVVYTCKCTKNFLAWPDNEQWVVEVYEATKNKSADQEMQVGKVGPYTVELSGDTARQALEWNPQSNRGRGIPRNTWRRMVLEEAKGVKKTWAGIKSDAKNRVWWRNLVEALCSTAKWRDIIIIAHVMQEHIPGWLLVLKFPAPSGHQ